MYCVFIIFSLKPLIKIVSYKKTLWNILSLKYLFNYIYIWLTFLIKFFKKFY
jgi:hypothetical protein